MTDAARLFVAAELPEAVRGELVRWTRHSVAAGSGARRLEGQSLHLTLCFLGQQPLACVADLAGVLGGLVEDLSTVGELVIGAPVWLPPRRPRALAVEIGDTEGGLHKLRAALAADLAATIAWQPGRQRFRPHVTVARLRAEARPLVALAPTPPLRFACGRVVLFRSHLERDGARYEELASVGGW